MRFKNRRCHQRAGSFDAGERSVVESGWFNQVTECKEVAAAGTATVRKYGWRLALGGLVGIALLALFFRGVDAGGLGRALLAAHPLPLLGFVAVSLATYLIRAWRWQKLLAPLGRVSVGRLFFITVAGFTTGFLVPRAGELVRPYLVARRHGIPTSAGFATIVLERLLDLATVLVLFALYVFVLPVPPMQRSDRGARRPEGCRRAHRRSAPSSCSLVLFLLSFHADRAMGLLERLLSKLPERLGQPLLGMARSFAGGLGVLQAPPSHLALILGQSLLLWLVMGLAFHLNNLAFGIDLPAHSVFLLMTFLVVGVSIPTPGMVGGFHAFFLLALNGVFGVDRDLAVAAGLTAHALSNLPVLLLGIAFLSREGLSMEKVAEMSSEPADAGGAPQ